MHAPFHPANPFAVSTIQPGTPATTCSHPVPTCGSGSSKLRCMYSSTSWLVCPQALQASSCWTCGEQGSGRRGGAGERMLCRLRQTAAAASHPERSMSCHVFSRDCKLQHPRAATPFLWRPPATRHPSGPAHRKPKVAGSWVCGLRDTDLAAPVPLHLPAAGRQQEEW